MNGLRRIYETKYKTLILIPILIFVLAVVQIGTQIATTGDFVNKGISLKGGSTITIDAAGIDQDLLESQLQQDVGSAIAIRTLGSAASGVSLAIDSDAQTDQEIVALTTAITEHTKIPKSDMSIEVVGSSLGESFFKQTIVALLVAFALMGVVVFLYFRSFVPSITVIASAFFDIIITLAIFNLTGLSLGSAGIAAFLMIIGYSVDTDILLNTRVLKRSGDTPIKRVYQAMRTGLTMSGTTLTALFIGMIFVKSDIVFQIMLILFIGICVDVLVTYIFNVAIIRSHVEKK